MVALLIRGAEMLCVEMVWILERKGPPAAVGRYSGTRRKAGFTVT
jgi:hypothetical protein